MRYSYHDPEHRYETARTEAAQQHREDLVGWTWFDHDQGLIRQVVAYDRDVRTVEWKPEIRTRPLSQYRTVKQRRREFFTKGKAQKPISRRVSYFAGHDVYKKHVDNNVAHRRIHVFSPDGTFMRVEEHTEETLRDLFFKSPFSNSNTEGSEKLVPRNITSLDRNSNKPTFAELLDPGHQLEAAGPGGNHRIDVPLPRDGKVSLRPIAEHQLRLELERKRRMPGWLGLAWMDEHGYTETVVWEGTIIHNHGLPTARIQRVVEVRTADHDTKAVQYKLYRLDSDDSSKNPVESLEKHLNHRGKNAPPLDLHWEVPGPEPNGLGGAALAGAGVEFEHETAPPSDDVALMLLSNHELYNLYNESDQAAFMNFMEERRQEPAMREKIATLQKIIYEVGFDKFNTVIGELFAAYTTDLRLLGIELASEDHSRSWIIEGLVDLHREDPDSNPFADSSEGSIMRRKLICDHVGEKLYVAGISEREDAAEEWRQGPTGFERGLKPLTKFSRNTSITNRLKGLIYEREILNTLDKRKNGDEPLLHIEEIRSIGYWVEASLGRNF